MAAFSLRPANGLAWVLRREVQHLGAQACGAVGHGQAGHVRLARVGKAGVHLDGCVNLLLGLCHGHQLGQRFDLREQGQLAAFHLAGFEGLHIAVGFEQALGCDAPVVFQPDAGAVLRGVEVLGHLLNPLLLDGAAISGCAFGSDTEKTRFGCHGLRFLERWWSK